MLLNELVKIKRRYTRSVNLERDLEKADSVEGYILTPNIYSIVDRFLKALLTPNSVRAWTLTGVYGTGKSAFAHFLASLIGRKNENIQKNALDILKSYDKSSLKSTKQLPANGLVKAIVTSQREPIAVTLIRGLHMGASNHWKGLKGAKPGVLTKLSSVIKKVDKGSPIDNKIVLHLIKEVSKASKTGLLIIVDELGKNLEYAAQHQNVSDLYLLQQIAELPSTKQDPTIFFIGLLHQSFSDYTHSLTTAQKNEWAKIQGRFEDIPLAESPERILYLIGNAFDHSNGKAFTPSLNKWARYWKSALVKMEFLKSLSDKELSSIFPLHPIAAFALPILCNKFSQNDRTLFTFLASEEPHSFTSFLKAHSINGKALPTFKIHQLYDYFIESAGVMTSMHKQNQRWVEIQDRISDARHLDVETIQVLKTIGILNLISNTGSLKASRKLVSLAMCDSTDKTSNMKKWDKIIVELTKKGFVTWRKQLDELRIWEGSDFDIDKEVNDQMQQIRTPLSELLNEYYPTKPFVARRHSYQTGTLRYFERQFVDEMPSNVNTSINDSDGVIFYVVGRNKSKAQVPNVTDDGKPIIIVQGAELKFLKLAAHEFVAHRNVEKHAKQLQSDGVARSEMRQRKYLSKNILDSAVLDSFDFNSNEVECWMVGDKETITSEKAFNAKLSDICDKTYDKGLYLWNELINRSELTSQGTKARRELFEAMLNNSGEELLGIKGYGPERAMFESLLNVTGIYSSNKGKWTFNEPNKDSGVYEVWKAIESFCKEATEAPKSVDQLFQALGKPPYGVKHGAIPIFLLSVLLYHSDYISVYFDGTYIPILNASHYELLVKRPDKFAIKYFEITGLRAHIFKELEEVVKKPSSNTLKNIRNITLLGIVNPLVNLIRKLPQYSLKTEKISNEAKAIRKAIIEAREPDHLLFVSLPQACGLPIIDCESTFDSTKLQSFRKKLIQSLQELKSSYDNLLNNSHKLLFNAFSVSSDRVKLRDDLCLRANHLKGQVIEPLLKRFIYASTNTVQDDRQWLESVVMMIADKPVISWTDNDAIMFESKLSDLSRRFKNLEAIQKQLVEMPGEGFDARKVTLTFPDGNEINDVIWIDHDKKETINNIVHNFLDDDNLKQDDRMKRAVITVIVEKVFAQKEKQTTTTAQGKGRKKHAQ